MLFQLRFVFPLPEGAGERVEGTHHLQRALAECQRAGQRFAQRAFVVHRDDEVGHRPVSYTHLTLPTSDLV